MTSASQKGHEHRGPEKGEAYGAAAVTQALEGVDFPISKKDLLKHIKGHETIHWKKDKTLSLRSLIEQTGRDRFENMRELVEAISETMREEETA